MRTVIALTAATVMLAAVSAGAATGSGSGSGKVLAINCNTTKYKPRGITIACADAGIYLSKLHWKKWTSSKATASGKYNENTCTPSCVSGHIESFRVKVTLSDPKSCAKVADKVFTRLTLKFESKPPKGTNRKLTFPCP